MRLFCWCAFVTVPIYFVGACAPPEHQITSAVAATEAAQAQIAFEKLRAEGFSGAVAVRKGGRAIYSAAAGEAAAGVPFSAETTVIDIASISKPVTAMAVLKLAEVGKLRLDDTLGRWFPEAPPDKLPITIRQLLSHSSGIVDIPDGMTDYTPISSGRMAALLLDAPLQFQPGERWSYSNGGYNLLAAIVERASDRSFFDFLEREVFAKAGVQANYDPQRFPAEAVAGAFRDGSWVDVRSLASARKGPFWGLWGAGGLFISAADLARLTEAFMHGRIVSPELVNLSITPVLPEEGGQSYAGLGWALIPITLPGASAKWFVYHNGGSGHSNTDLRYYPELAITIATVSNQARGSGTGAGRAISRAILGIAPKS